MGYLTRLAVSHTVALEKPRTLLPSALGGAHVSVLLRLQNYVRVERGDVPERHRFGLWHASHGREKREKPLRVLIIQSASPFECA